MERPAVRAALAAICAILLATGCVTGQVLEQAHGATLAAAPDQAETRPDAETPAKDPDIRDGDYWKSYPDNGGRILTAPLRWDRGDWLVAALVAGATGGLVLLDEELRDFWQDDVRGDASDTASDLLRPFDSTAVTMATSLGAYAVAEAFDAEREQAAALLTLESLVLTSAVVAGLKTLSGRDRPEDNDDATEFRGPRHGGIDDAFPSGHSSHAFALAATL